MRKARTLSFIIIYLPLTLMIISSAIFLMRVVKHSLVYIPSVIASLAANSINGIVDIGSIDVYYSDGIIIKDIRITGFDKDSAKILIPKAVIKLNLRKHLFKSDDLISSIKLVDIEKPDIAITRRKNGKWSIYELIKPKTETASVSFRAPIQIRDANVQIKDYVVSANHNPEVNQFHEVNGLIDFHKADNIKFDVSGKGDEYRLSLFNASGIYNLSKGSYRINMHAEDMSARYWSRYPYNIHLDVRDGYADANIQLVQTDIKTPVDYRITADAADIAVKFKEIKRPITKIRGRIDIAPNIVSIDLKSAIIDSPIDISGYIVDFSNPQLALDIYSSNLNVKNVIENTIYAKSFQDAALPSNGKIKARIVGDTSSPGIKFKVIAPFLGYDKIKLSSVSASGVYVNNRITLDKAIANGLGGSVKSTGTIDFSNGVKVNLVGDFKSVKAKDIPYLKGVDLTAAGNGSFVFAYKPGDVRVDYLLELQNPRYMDFQFSNVFAKGSYHNGVTNISSLRTGISGGRITASGHIGKDNSLDLAVYGTNLDIAPLVKNRIGSPITGKGQLAGRLTGSYESPQFEGVAEAYDVYSSDIKAERISGTVIANRDTVFLDKMIVYKYPGDAVISGGIIDPLGSNPLLSFNAQINSFDMGNLFENGKITNLDGGILSGNVRLTGHAKNLNASGSIKLTDALYNNVPIDSLSGSIFYNNKNTSFRSVELVSGNARLFAQGDIGRNKSINAALTGNSIPLDQFSAYTEPYVSINGFANIDGTVTGTLTEPEAVMHINGEGTVINKRRFTSIEAKLMIDKEFASIKDFKLTDEDSMFGIPSAEYNLQTKTLQADANITGGKGNTILSLVDFSPYAAQQNDEGAEFRQKLYSLPRPINADINASLTGKIKFSSNQSVPDLSLEAAIKNLVYGDSGKISDISMKGSWQDDVVALEQFEASEGKVNVSAEGMLGPKDNVFLGVDIHNFDASFMKQFAKIPDSFSGDADITMVASGSRYNPTVQMSLEVVDPILAGTKFDRLRAGLSSVGVEAEANDTSKESVGSIDIDEITLAKDGHYVKTSGYIPVDWHGLKLRRDEPILLESIIDEDVLSFISSISGLDIGTQENGKFEGAARLSGTILNPEFSGVLALTNGYVKIPKISNTFEIDKADFSLAGNKIMIDNFNGHSSKGGVFNADGNITFQALKPMLDINVRSDALKVSAKNISNSYGENADVEITGNAAITGEVINPLIKGDLNAKNGQILIPGKSEPKEALKVSNFNPNFDLAVLLGDKLQLKASIVKVPLNGLISIRGLLKQVNINGSVDISDGTIAFPVRTMKLQDGSTASIYVVPNQQPQINLNIIGQTRLTARTDLGSRKQYNITMIAHGNVFDLDAQFITSPPGLTKQEVLAMLTGQKNLELLFAGGKDYSFGRELSDIFTSAFLPGVFDPISQTFGTALGLDEFIIDLRYNEPIYISLGENIGGDFTLYYTTYLGSRPDYADSAYELKLTKTLKKYFEVGISKDNKEVKLLLEGRIRF